MVMQSQWKNRTSVRRSEVLIMTIDGIKSEEGAGRAPSFRVDGSLCHNTQSSLVSAQKSGPKESDQIGFAVCVT